MDAKAAALEKLDSIRASIADLSHKIHANPELGFEEVKASAWISDLLSEEGFDVKTGICEIPTAFLAKTGSGPLNVCICAEYDALPGIGHACGHNIIAAAAAGAGSPQPEQPMRSGFRLRYWARLRKKAAMPAERFSSWNVEPSPACMPP